MSRSLKDPREEVSPTLQVSKVSESVEIEQPRVAKDIPPAKLSIRNLEAWFGTKRALKGISLDVRENSITAFIGPA